MFLFSVLGFGFFVFPSSRMLISHTWKLCCTQKGHLALVTGRKTQSAVYICSITALSINPLGLAQQPASRADTTSHQDPKYSQSNIY